MPVVGNNLILTPICIIACNNIKLAEPTKINLAVLFASLSTFFKIEKINSSILFDQQMLSPDFYLVLN